MNFASIFDAVLERVSGSLVSDALHLSFGRREGLKLVGSPIDAARVFIATLEGAMMLARAYSDIQAFDRATACLVPSPPTAIHADAAPPLTQGSGDPSSFV